MSYLSLCGREWGGVGAYSRWALIRGWALIRINTVTKHLQLTKISSFFFNRTTKKGTSIQVKHWWAHLSWGRGWGKQECPWSEYQNPLSLSSPLFIHGCKHQTLLIYINIKYKQNHCKPPFGLTHSKQPSKKAAPRRYSRPIPPWATTKDMVFAPFRSENGYRLYPFWSRSVWTFRVNKKERVMQIRHGFLEVFLLVF